MTKYADLTPEQKAERLAKRAARRASQTPEQKAERLAKRAAARARRLTPEEQAARSAGGTGTLAPRTRRQREAAQGHPGIVEGVETNADGFVLFKCPTCPNVTQWVHPKVLSVQCRKRHTMKPVKA